MRKVIALCLILLASTCYAATVTIEVEDDMEIVIKKKAVKALPMNTFQAYSSVRWGARTTLEHGW